MMIGYIIARHIKDNVYMPVYNPSQIRYVLNKDFYGETKLFIDLEQALITLKALNTDKKLVILTCMIQTILERDNHIVNAYSFLPYNTYAEKIAV